MFRDAERQRQRERALGIALGAQRWRLVLLVMGTAARFALLGAAMGIVLSAAIVRFLISDFAIVTSPSLEVWLVAPLLPVAAVMMVSIVPARRASGHRTCGDHARYVEGVAVAGFQFRYPIKPR